MPGILLGRPACTWSTGPFNAGARRAAPRSCRVRAGQYAALQFFDRHCGQCAVLPPHRVDPRTDCGHMALTVRHVDQHVGVKKVFHTGPNDPRSLRAARTMARTSDDRCLRCASELCERDGLFFGAGLETGSANGLNAVFCKRRCTARLAQMRCLAMTDMGNCGTGKAPHASPDEDDNWATLSHKVFWDRAVPLAKWRAGVAAGHRSYLPDSIRGMTPAQFVRHYGKPAFVHDWPGLRASLPQEALRHAPRFDLAWSRAAGGGFNLWPAPDFHALAGKRRLFLIQVAKSPGKSIYEMANLLGLQYRRAHDHATGLIADGKIRAVDAVRNGRRKKSFTRRIPSRRQATDARRSNCSRTPAPATTPTCEGAALLLTVAKKRQPRHFLLPTDGKACPSAAAFVTISTCFSSQPEK